MGVGRFRHRVQVIPNSGNIGDESPTYTGAAILPDWPCNVYDIAGGELFRGRQTEAQITHVLEGHYHSQITHDCQIKHGDKTYEIDKILDRQGRKRKLEIHCVEIGAA